MCFLLSDHLCYYLTISVQYQLEAVIQSVAIVQPRGFPSQGQAGLGLNLASRQNQLKLNFT